MELPRILLFTISSLIYLVILALLFRKLFDIYTHKDKYERIKNFHLFRKSFWNEPMSDYHKKFFSKNYLSTLVAFFILDVPIFAAIYFGTVWIQELLFKPSDIVRFFRPDAFGIGLIPAVFLTFSLAAYICFLSGSPLMIAASMNLFNSKKRVNDWQKVVIGLLVTFMITFPMLVLSVDTYAYISDKEIVLNPYMGFSEMHLTLDQVSKVRTTYSRQDSRGISYHFHYEVIANDGRSNDIGYAGSSAIRFIHQRLSNQAIEFEKARMSQADLSEIKTKYKESFVSVLTEIFAIDQG